MYTREYIVPRLSQVVETKGFLEMDHLLSKQLIREVVHKRKLVHVSNDDFSMRKIAKSDSNNGDDTQA